MKKWLAAASVPMMFRPGPISRWLLGTTMKMVKLDLNYFVKSRTNSADPNEMYDWPKDEVEITSQRIPSGDSEIEVRICKLKKSEGKPLPIVVYFHGGGFVIVRVGFKLISTRELRKQSTF
jgi:acetyl esterase/lipase